MTHATAKDFLPNNMKDSMSVTFKKPLSATAIAAMKVWIESNYTVSFLYEGNEYDYTVTLEGTQGPFKRAMSTLFPSGRQDIIIQRSSAVG